MIRSVKRGLVGVVALTFIALTADPAHADPQPPPEQYQQAVEPSVAPLLAPARLVNGDGDTVNECVEIANNDASRLVYMAGCHSNANQGWTIRRASSITYAAYYQIETHDRDVSYPRCITDDQPSYPQFNGIQVVVTRCNGLSEPQMWTMTRRSDGWFQLKNLWTGLCLDVRDGGLSNIIQTWSCGGLSKGNQIWKLT